MPRAGTDYTVNGNDWINTDFVVSAAPGRQLSETGAEGSWTDRLSAGDETADGELSFYVRDAATGALSGRVTERYRIDKTAPSATAALAGFDGTWSQVVDPVSFGRFFATARTLGVEAADALSGVAKVEHHVSEAQLSEPELAALPDGEWEEVSGGRAVLGPQDGSRFVCYLRVSDRAGNRAYLSTDGGTWDTRAPAIDGVQDGATYYVTRRASVTDANLASVTLDGQDVTAGARQVELAGDRRAEHVIEAADRAGNASRAAVSMRPLSDLEKELDGIDGGNPKDGDREKAEEVKRILDGIDLSYATDDEKAKVAALKERVDALLAQIDAAQGGAGKADRVQGESGDGAGRGSGRVPAKSGDGIAPAGAVAAAALACAAASAVAARRRSASTRRDAKMR